MRMLIVVRGKIYNMDGMRTMIRGGGGKHQRKIIRVEYSARFS